MHYRNGFSTFQAFNSWFWNKDPDIIPEEAPLIILDSKSAVCIAKNGKYAKHTMQISRIVQLVINGNKCKMHNIDWCEVGLKLSNIATKNVGEKNLYIIMKYIMVRLDN